MVGLDLTQVLQAVAAASGLAKGVKIMNREMDLNVKLEAYETKISVSYGMPGMDGMPAWAFYAAAMASGLAMTTAAEAQIVYSGVQNVTATLGTNNVPVDIDGQGNAFNLHVFNTTWTGGFVHHTAAASIGAAVGGGIILNGSGGLKRLASGVKISNGAGAFGANSHHLFVKSSSFGTFVKGTWAENQTGFAGVNFKEGSDTHFGWIRLKWNSSGDGFPNTLTALDWAYNTVANQSIKAGQTSAVPEPAVTVVAAALASGWAGVAAWRSANRRQAKSAQ